MVNNDITLRQMIDNESFDPITNLIRQRNHSELALYFDITPSDDPDDSFAARAEYTISGVVHSGEDSVPVWSKGFWSFYAHVTADQIVEHLICELQETETSALAEIEESKQIKETERYLDDDYNRTR